MDASPRPWWLFNIVHGKSARNSLIFLVETYRLLEVLFVYGPMVRPETCWFFKRVWNISIEVAMHGSYRWIWWHWIDRLGTLRGTLFRMVSFLFKVTHELVEFERTRGLNSIINRNTWEPTCSLSICASKILGTPMLHQPLVLLQTTMRQYISNSAPRI